MAAINESRYRGAARADPALAACLGLLSNIWLLDQSTNTRGGVSYLAPATERWLRAAGLVRGLRVLDVGCGVGDVTLQAAGLVGPEGEVVGVDGSANSVATARERAETLGIPHMRCEHADLMTLSFDTPFDAVIGRRVLVHVADPVAAIRGLVHLVRPGGIIAFAELTIPSIRSWPRAPLVE